MSQQDDAAWEGLLRSCTYSGLCCVRLLPTQLHFKTILVYIVHIKMCCVWKYISRWIALRRDIRHATLRVSAQARGAAVAEAVAAWDAMCMPPLRCRPAGSQLIADGYMMPAPVKYVSPPGSHPAGARSVHTQQLHTSRPRGIRVTVCVTPTPSQSVYIPIYTPIWYPLRDLSQCFRRGSEFTTTPTPTPQNCTSTYEYAGAWRLCTCRTRGACQACT